MYFRNGKTRRSKGWRPQGLFLSPEFASGLHKVQHVIRTEDIRALAEAQLEGTPGFLVDVVVGDGSNIRVIVDHDEHIH